MNFSDLGKNIASVAPILGSVIAGPGGAAIGALVANIFGADSKNPSDIWNKITGDKEYQLKLLTIQAEHEVELQKLQLQQSKAIIEDRQDARNKSDKKLIAFITYIFVLGFFCCIGGMFYLVVRPGDIAINEMQVLILLIGQLSTIVMMIAAFHLGEITKNFKPWKNPDFN